MNVFIDTEFTDLLDPILISIGMVADTGEEFYAEVPYPDNKCTAFVREAVIPYLGREPNAFCSLSEMPRRIQTWLEIIRRKDEDIIVCFDYTADWDLFSQVIQYRIPSWVKPRLCGSDFNELLLYEYFKKNPSEVQHHALSDARANRFAYRPRDSETLLAQLLKKGADEL
ncbi:MAG: 3'-5' exoribonuclease [bacterium]|nr:3'-5' exoribonuclease [bacterium]